MPRPCRHAGPIPLQRLELAPAGGGPGGGSRGGGMGGMGVGLEPGGGSRGASFGGLGIRVMVACATRSRAGL